MKNLIIVFSIFLSGCAGVGQGIFTDLRLDNAMRTGVIGIGSTTGQVERVISRPMPFCIKQRITEAGNLVMWDYASRSCGNNFSHSYALIFRDGKLSEIRTVKSQYDMQL